MKQCKEPGCENNVWGKGYCNFHQYRRTDLKKYVYKRKKTGELELFQEIWDNRPHESFLTGQTLSRFDVRMFAHVVAKGKCELLRLQPANIILLTPYEHFLLDQGTQEQRYAYSRKWGCDWAKIFRLKQQLLDAVKEFENT